MTSGEKQPHWIAQDATSALQSADKFSYFCDTICGTYTGIRPEKHNDDPFDAEFAAAQLGSCVLAQITAPGHTARRDKTLLRTQPDEHLFLNFSPFDDYQATHLMHDGTVSAHTPFLLDNEHLFQVDFEKHKRMNLYSLRIPKTALATKLTPKRTAALNHDLSHSNVGHMTATQMRLMSAAFDKNDLKTASAMSYSVLSLMNALCLENDQCAEDEKADALSISAIKAYAHTNITTPEFGVTHVAEIFGVSTRTIQSIFAKHDLTFSSWLLSQRLEKARSILSNPRYRIRSVESIAFACGFRDATYFYRAFKKRFQITPSAARHLS